MKHTSLFLVALLGTISVGQSATIRFIEISSLPGTTGDGLPSNFHVAEVEAFLAGVTPAAGLDNANDQALASMGASAATVAGAVNHGVDGALINGVADGGGSTWDRNRTTVPAMGAVGLVDLGATLDIDTVRLWQRSDGCCQNRLENFTVNFYADDGSGGVGALVDSIAHPGLVAANTPATFNLVPEPSSTALMGLAGMALLFRRRK